MIKRVLQDGFPLGRPSLQKVFGKMVVSRICGSGHWAWTKH